MKRILCFLTLPILLAGCGQKGQYKPTSKKEEVKPASLATGQERSLLPLKKGDQWVYTVAAGGKKQDMTLRVQDVVSDSASTRATLVATNDQGSGLPSIWVVDGTGIYQASERPERQFIPPQLLISFPLKPYETKKMSGTGPYPIGGDSGPYDLTVKYVGTQEVDTDMGRMSAFAVESVMSWSTLDGKCTSYAITWWVPNVGFVRQRQEISTPKVNLVVLMKLKSYSPS